MKNYLFWTLAVVITIASAIYQRKTGPTHPKKMQISYADQSYKFSLPRSGDSNEDLLIEIPINDTAVDVKLYYRRYPVNESFTEINTAFKDNKLITSLPKQPPAGKLEYFISLHDTRNNSTIETEHIVVRFKDTVPTWAIVPHVLLMFIAMLISNLAGLYAIGKNEKHIFYGRLALILLVLGGMVFGPIIQYYAFGQAWTGIPFGWDLTDNKTLIAVIFWIVAVWGNYKSPKYRYSIIASVVLFLIFIIPHSMFGSELDYSSGEVITGFISLFY